MRMSLVLNVGSVNVFRYAGLLVAGTLKTAEAFVTTVGDAAGCDRACDRVADDTTASTASTTASRWPGRETARAAWDTVVLLRGERRRDRLREEELRRGDR